MADGEVRGLAYYSVPAIRRLQLGRELKAWREQAGLTLEQAGGDLDLSKSTLSRLEKGQGAIHPLHARAMAELYRVPEDDLIPPGTITDIGYVDHAGGNLQLVKPTQVATLTEQFRGLSKIALGENESRALVLQLADLLNT